MPAMQRYTATPNGNVMNSQLTKYLSGGYHIARGVSTARRTVPAPAHAAQNSSDMARCTHAWRTTFGRDNGHRLEIAKTPGVRNAYSSQSPLANSSSGSGGRGCPLRRRCASSLTTAKTPGTIHAADTSIHGRTRRRGTPYAIAADGAAQCHDRSRQRA